jgi:hypothetical protein
MQKRDPAIVFSDLSRPVTRAGLSVTVEIFRLEHEPCWHLEVVSPTGTSTLWDDAFESDDAAYAEFRRTADEEGLNAFLQQTRTTSVPR